MERSWLPSEERSEGLDFAGLGEADAGAVRRAIAQGENFAGYIPSEESVRFITRNYRQLAALRILEARWLDTYVHTSHFGAFGVAVLKDVFDACDRDRLLALKPLGQ